MKKISIIFLIVFLNCQGQEYKLLKSEKRNFTFSGKKRTGTFTTINTSEIIKLNESLKALASYYASIASTDFDSDGNSLINALNLGEQGSEEHINLIKKWFSNDRMANIILKQGCFQPSPGSSYFRVFDYLNFRVKTDTVMIDYKISLYNHGKSSSYNGTDKALVKNNNIKMLVQNSWK